MLSCCSTKTVESKLEPYQLRTLLIKRIHRFSRKGIFGQAISVFRELSKDLGVNAATRRLSSLGTADFLKAREILVDSQAHRLLHRLQEALFRKDERQVSQMCKLLTKQFNFAPTDDIAKELKRQNKVTLKQSDLENICIYGWDLSKKKNLQKLLGLLRRCPKVKKIELSFCKLGQSQILELFQGVTKVERLHFLGLRGNRLEMKAVHKLLSLLEDPENFQTLLWVDFRNNKEINTIPGKFVDLLAKRKERNSSMRKASDEEIRLAVKDAIRGKIE